MGLKIGITGLPNVGKSTLFNALTRSSGAAAANYPFCTIEPNIGLVEVPDERLTKLSELVKPEKVIPTVVEFVDIAGLVRGASKGEGLGNAFLSHIREVDAICHVIRVFTAADVIHVEGSTDPKRDREIIEAELIIADLDVVQKRINRVSGGARSGGEEEQKELAVLQAIEKQLNAGAFAMSAPLDEQQQRIARSLTLLTSKPFLYALNASEQQLSELSLDEARQMAGLRQADQAILVSAKLEEELVSLKPDEAGAMLHELGVKSSGLDKLIRAAYDTLGLITFFTAGPKEVRAWTVIRGTKAPQAAGVIHSDFERGFIRAETIAYKDFMETGSEAKAREQGKLGIEGKDYVVQDGDIMHFRFKV